MIPLLAGLWLGSPAAAHPEMMRIVSHRTWVVVGDDRVRVDYYAELPIGGGDPTAVGPEHRFDVESFTELATGLLLTIDGQTVPLEPVPGFDPELHASGTRVGCRILLDASLPPGDTHTIALSNGNYPDLPGYFSNAIDVTTAFEVTDSTLVEHDGWKIVRDWNGGWGVGDEHRSMSATLRRLDGPVWGATRWLAGTTGQLRSSADAMPRPVWVQWLLGGWSPGTCGGLAALAAGLGGAAGASARWGGVVAAGVGLLALGIEAGSVRAAGAMLIVAAACGGIGWRAARERPTGPIPPLVAAVVAAAVAALRSHGFAILY